MGVEHNLYDMRFHKRDSFPSSNDYHFDEDGNNQVMSLINRHNGDDQNLNIHSQPLDKIFKSEFWKEIVWSWEQDIGCGKIFECAMTCGQKLTKVWDQNKKRLFEEPKVEYSSRALSSLIKSVNFSKNKYPNVKFKIIIVPHGR